MRLRQATAGGPTRRELLLRGCTLVAAGSAGATLAGAGLARADDTSTTTSTPPQSPQQNDASVLLPVVGTEMLAAFVYQQVLDAGVFPPHIQRATDTILNQEQMHITALSAELVRLGGTPPTPFSKVSRRRQGPARAPIPGWPRPAEERARLHHPAGADRMAARGRRLRGDPEALDAAADAVEHAGDGERGSARDGAGASCCTRETSTRRSRPHSYTARHDAGAPPWAPRARMGPGVLQ